MLSLLLLAPRAVLRAKLAVAAPLSSGPRGLSNDVGTGRNECLDAHALQLAHLARRCDAFRLRRLNELVNVFATDCLSRLGHNQRVERPKKIAGSMLANAFAPPCSKLLPPGPGRGKKGKTGAANCSLVQSNALGSIGAFAERERLSRALIGIGHGAMPLDGNPTRLQCLGVGLGVVWVPVPGLAAAMTQRGQRS